MSRQFVQNNVMGNDVKSFNEADNIYSLSPIHETRQAVMEEDQVLKQELSDPLVALYALHDGTRGDLFHDLPLH